MNCAAAYWETAITADIGSMVLPEGYVAGCALYGDRYRGREVDDLMIVVHFADQSAPATSWACEERPDNGLPATARVAFASNSERYDLPRIAATTNSNIMPAVLDEDLDFLYNLARHEIGHALGFGSSSAFQALVSEGSFRGQNATEAWGSPVPMDDHGHHRAGVRRDIMYSRVFASQTATRVTLGAMEDIG